MVHSNELNRKILHVTAWFALPVFMHATWIGSGYFAGVLGQHLYVALYFILPTLLLEVLILDLSLPMTKGCLPRILAIFSVCVGFTMLVAWSPFKIHQVQMAAFHKYHFGDVSPDDIEKWADTTFNLPTDQWVNIVTPPDTYLRSFPAKDIAVDVELWGLGKDPDFLRITLKDKSTYMGIFVARRPRDIRPKYTPMVYRKLSSRVFLYHAYRP